MRQSQSPLGFAIAEPSWFCNRRARLVLPQSPLGFTAALAMLVD